MEATGQMLDEDHSDDRPDAQKTIDDYSSEHDATTSPPTMFNKYYSVGERVVSFVQQTSVEAVQPNVLQTVTSMLCSGVNGSLKQACANGDFDLNMIQIEVGGEENIPTGRC